MPSSDERTLIDIQGEIHRDTELFFPDVDIDLGYLTVALCGEAGEFANILKKIMRGSKDVNDKVVRVEMAFELVDVLIYTAMLANLLDIDLAEAYKHKREQNVERFGKPDPDTEDGGSGTSVVESVPSPDGNGG